MSTIQALSRHLWCVLAYGKSSVDYRARLEGLQPVGKLIRNLSAQECRVQWELVCCAHLVKNIILSQLKLLCLSEELEHDIEYAFRECKALFKAAENFNRHVVVQLAYGRPTQPCHTSLWLKSSTVIKIVLDCRSQKVMDKLLQNPNAVTVIHTVRFETGFLRALMGSLATHTSTFHPQGGVPYVLEEAFSLAEAEMSWLDCLVPGAQSKALRRSTQWMEAQLWRLVAAQLVAAHQPLYMESFAAALEEATGREELECHSAASIHVGKYLTTIIKMQKMLSLWDTGFQVMLAASQEDTSRGYRGVTSTVQLLSKFVPTIQSFTTHPRGSMAEQLNMLQQSRTVCLVAAASSSLASVFLTRGLDTALCTWNLRILAQLLFVDGPVACTATTTLVNTYACRASSPLIAFPVGSPLCTLMSSSCSCYELLHRRNSSMKEAMDNVLRYFYDEWKARCAELLRKTFPPARSWRAIGRKTQLTQLSPSAYCQAVTEHLLLPVAEAASVLPLQSQRSFLYLTISVFVQQFRRTITANKKTYRPAAGRQLLTDYRHLYQWLRSGELGLHDETAHLLASLPTLAEVEQGLLTICGTASPMQPLHTTPNLQLPSSHTNLPVFVEQAWHSNQDWLECIA